MGHAIMSIMNTVAIPRSAYSEILKRQERADEAIAKLQKAVQELGYDDELLPEVATRIERQSRLLDEGKGKRFKNMKEVRAYVRSL